MHFRSCTQQNEFLVIVKYFLIYIGLQVSFLSFCENLQYVCTDDGADIRQSLC